LFQTIDLLIRIASFVIEFQGGRTALILKPVTGREPESVAYISHLPDLLKKLVIGRTCSKHDTIRNRSKC
jgi:hypothetical protein